MNSWLMKDKVPNRHPYVESALEPPLRLAWKADVGSSIFSQILAHEEIAYITSLRDVRAVELKTGELKWTFRTRKPKSNESGPFLKGTPVVWNKSLYLADDLGDLYCIDIETGELRWKVDGINSENESICLDGNSIYLKSTKRSPEANNGRWIDGYLCLGPDGEEKWFFNSDDIIFTKQPAIYSGTLIFGDASGVVYGVDSSTGKSVWKTDISEEDEMKSISKFRGAFGALSIVGGLAIMHIGSDRYYAAVDVESGETRWIHNAGAIAKNAVCNTESLFYITHTGIFRRVELETGKVAFQRDNSNSNVGHSFAHSALIVGSYLVAGFSQGNKFGVFTTTDGNLVWEFTAGGNFNAPSMFIDGRILVGNDDGNVYCFEES